MAKKQALSPLCHPYSPEENKITTQKHRHQGLNPMFQSAAYNYYPNHTATDPIPTTSPPPTSTCYTNIK